MHSPTVVDFYMVKHILRYIRGTLHLSLQIWRTVALSYFALVMPIGLDVMTLGDPPLVFVSFLVLTVSPGVQRNNPQLLAQLLRQSIDLLHLLLLS